MKKETKELIEEEKFDTEDNDWEKSNNRAVERIINIIKSNPPNPHTKMKKEIIIKIIGGLLTFGGLVVVFFYPTNGLLMMILGELVDMPYRIADKLTPPKEVK